MMNCLFLHCTIHQLSFTPFSWAWTQVHLVMSTLLLSSKIAGWFLFPISFSHLLSSLLAHQSPLARSKVAFLRPHRAEIFFHIGESFMFRSSTSRVAVSQTFRAIVESNSKSNLTELLSSRSEFQHSKSAKNDRECKEKCSAVKINLCACASSWKIVVRENIYIASKKSEKSGARQHLYLPLMLLD